MEHIHEGCHDKVFRHEIDLKLIEAEIEYQRNPVTHTHEEVMERLRGIIQNAENGEEPNIS